MLESIMADSNWRKGYFNNVISLKCKLMTCKRIKNITQNRLFDVSGKFFSVFLGGKMS